jgi:hypothetical protein
VVKKVTLLLLDKGEGEHDHSLNHYDICTTENYGGVPTTPSSVSLICPVDNDSFAFLQQTWSAPEVSCSSRLLCCTGFLAFSATLQIAPSQ